MYIYYKVKNNNIYDILCSLSININDDIIFLNKPCIDEKTSVVRIKISDLEKFYLVNISKGCYRINKIFNIENRDIKFYVFDENTKFKILNNAKFIKEVKVNQDYLNKNIRIIKEMNSINYSIDSSSIEIIKNKNNILFNKISSIKGIIYNMFINKQVINKYILFNYSKVYDEYNIINSMIDNLRNRKELNRELYSSLINSRNVLKKQIEKNLNEADFTNLLITDIKTNNIKFNNNILKLSLSELTLFENIINYIINRLSNLNSDKEKIIKIIKYLESRKEEFDIVEDYELLYKRVIKEDYSINIGEIKNDIVKNLYVVFIKHDNNKEFVMFIKEKQIIKNYIAYMFLGAITGFKYISSNLLEKNSYENKILKDSIRMIDSNLIDGNEQRYLQRLKIHYYLDKIYTKLENIDCKFEDYDFISNKEKKYVLLRIKRDNSVLEVFYRDNKKNMSNGIKYYNNRINELKKIKMDCENDNIYFNYRFIINNKVKTLDFRYEYIFGNLLEYVYNEGVK